MQLDRKNRQTGWRYASLGVLALSFCCAVLMGHKAFSASRNAEDTMRSVVMATTGGTTLTGHVLLQARPTPPNPRWSVPLSVTLLNPSGNYTFEFETNTDQSGYFTLTGDITPGVYQWRVKHPKMLAKAGIVTLVSGANQVEIGPLKPGDATNDNCVYSQDFILLKVSFNRQLGDPAYDARTDFNDDNNCNISDFGLLKRYFGECGAPTLAPFDSTPTATSTETETAVPTPSYTRTVSATPALSSTTTPTETSIVSPTATSTPRAACSLFPPDNIWNRNIVALPTHALSDSYIVSMGITEPLHADFGSGLYNGGPIGIPYTTVTSLQARVPVTFTYVEESDPGPYPIPTNAPIEGGPNSTGDRHVIVVDRDSCTLYEMFSAYPQADGSWRAGSGAVWSLDSNALRPYGWTSADAAGLPILPGLVTYDEVASGVINHALRFTAPRTQAAFIWPARHYASSDPDLHLPPMGLRVRLKASVNISGYPTELRVILQALKDYGMLLSDNGGPWEVTGVPDPRWDDDMLFELSHLLGSDFEAVDESELMIDPNSGQSR